MTDQAKIARAIAAYETARMEDRPRPRFTVHIDGNHFAAKRSRAGLIDVIAVAAGGAIWFAILAGLWIIWG